MQKSAIHGLTENIPQMHEISERSGGLELIRDYYELIKPRIIILLLISTACPMVLAGNGQVAGSLIFWALLGGALVSASASVLNCIWDKDVDAIMHRTKNRPLPAERVGVPAAFLYSVVLFVLGVAVLVEKLSWLAAAIAVFGHVFYLFVYTIWLKRSSVQNIVIGGAAGAVPPIVGWVGVTGRVDLEAILLFLLIFLWTPPHFWALAINKNGDYQRAGIPMMPVIRGEAATQRQMWYYAISLLPVSWLLIAVNDSLGSFSSVVLTILGVIFAWKVHRLEGLVARNPAELSPERELLKTKQSWDIFWFSIIYLALFFVCLVVDSVLL